MVRALHRFGAPAIVCLALGVGIGLLARELLARAGGKAPVVAADPTDGDELPPIRAGATDPNWDKPYPQYQPLGEVLKPCPDLKPGEPCPDEPYLYGGAGVTNTAAIGGKDFDAYYQRWSANKPMVMADRRAYLARRYDFTGAVNRDVTMTRGKPVPVGPVVRLPKGMASWQALAELSPAELRERDLFPEGFKPLSHPLQSNGLQLFPSRWIKIHPEHERVDVDFDIPDAYLPEFPPPLFLTTRPDLGDVSRGAEITVANLHGLFDNLITLEQIEGLRLLVTPFPTTWFNPTRHRITREPVRGLACFDCHVNGHSNGAIQLDPAVAPTLVRPRLDTPSLRGGHNNLVFSARRSIRSLDHFAEVEEYFDGYITFPPHIAGRKLDRVSLNRIETFAAIIAWPPAPKLDRLGRLIPAKASPAELRGEALFHAKARCATCHPAPFFTDNQLHDLRVEEFYRGRAEGWVKTFSLRGIKDTPPYFHDGRLPTLEDTVEFFNLLLELKLTAAEKQDLVAFMQAL
jgi:cytochrome c peroxidase